MPSDSTAALIHTDVLVVGAGPAGSSAAAWAARAGLDVLLVDAASFPRDKPCGDGLTPRAIAELERLGLGDLLSKSARNWGLRAAGFGQELLLPWPGGSLPAYGGACPRLELDAAILGVATAAGARLIDGARAVDVVRDGNRVVEVVVKSEAGVQHIACKRLIVADGARSQLGRLLGREWHKDTAYGVAARGYIDSDRGNDPWISSHLELRDGDGQILSGYGWVFPLGESGGAGPSVNIGVGTLATDARPADVNLRSLLKVYTEQQRADWGLHGEVRAPWSALLPMGGAVSGIAGPNWMLIGDAAGCVNPLNGEGIDYGLETGRLAIDVLTDGPADFSAAWPAILREHYGLAFSIARRCAGLLTVPHFLPLSGPVGMRSRTLMKVALRVMGNLITEEDSDLVAKAWRTAGRVSTKLDARPPFS